MDERPARDYLVQVLRVRKDKLESLRREKNALAADHAWLTKVKRAMEDAANPTVSVDGARLSAMADKIARMEADLSIHARIIDALEDRILEMMVEEAL